MKLKSYKSKRDLKTSPEPEARVQKSGKILHFVVQKHDATRLHYDFRLGVGGVLKSWAVPKGPSLDPNVKRLAIMVEDHPYDYREFEGVIPSGYGAGTVMVWDEGTYEIDGKQGKEAEKLWQEGFNKGHLHFFLNGMKLKGEFSLIKLKDKEDEWLLMKKKDSYSTSEEILKQDFSVKTNRSMEEIGGPFKKKPKKEVSISSHQNLSL